MRTRFWLEAALASTGFFLGVLTVLWRDWIEATTGFNPDRHNGSLEWMIATGLVLISAVAGLAARHEWRLQFAVAPEG